MPFICFHGAENTASYNKKDICKTTFDKKGEDTMKRYICQACGYEYEERLGEPDNGIAPGTEWDRVPEDYTCPLCGVGKDQFSEA